ncbi:unnamed protein product [Psylliodes chrysocephalus]|uniref:Alcohol dehydrogenase n=1 Tax=Psylliodes chrysocephalus TaxID=3402493 RepID=A0A9P0CWQ8_9CUCU|nr:unnamed protein product [Psylliodes chrysocephala]
MKALHFFAKTKKIQLVKLPIPKITEPGDVLVKVAYSGICGTDIHILKGKFASSEGPVILGHEFSGKVVEFGKNVTTFKEGDQIAVDPNNSCRSCQNCHLGKPHFCTSPNRTIGIFVDGGFSEYVVVPGHMVHKLPEVVNLKQGALAEPLSCISHGYDIIEPIPVGSKILITGTGIIGTLWACVLHLQGHRNVTICEPNKARLDNIKKLELDFTLLTPEELKENRTKNSNYAFDFVIDCSGYAPIIEYGINLLQKCGKHCCFGVASPEAEIKINPFKMFFNEWTIIGSKINPYSFPKALGWLEATCDRYFDYQKLGIKFTSWRNMQQLLVN